jgi:DNA helicase-2/ATP-dependent DNA helicase PcrA
VGYYPSANGLGATLKGAVLAVERACRKSVGRCSSIAVLGYRNRFIGRLSTALLQTGGTVPLPLHHRVVVTLDEVEPAWVCLTWMLQAIGAREPLLVGNALLSAATLARVRGRKNAAKEASKLERWARNLADGKLSKQAKGVHALLTRVRAGAAQVGNVRADVRAAMAAIQDLPGKPFGKVCEILDLRSPDRAGEPVGERLAERFAEVGSYAGCDGIVAEEFMREAMMGGDWDGRGRLLMTMHKAKGKEFDAVVIVDGPAPSPTDRLVRSKDSAVAGYPISRRLLHMAITRARTCVVIVTPRWDPCAILP